MRPCNSAYNLDNILVGGDALKSVNLSRARLFPSRDASISPEQFYKLAGLELLLNKIFEAFGEDSNNVEVRKESGKSKIASLFFEYSTLGSTLENNVLSSFLCLWQQEDLLDNKNLANQASNIISVLFSEKISLYYFPSFFLQPEHAYGTVTCFRAGKRDIILDKEDNDKYCEALDKYDSNKLVKNYSPDKYLREVKPGNQTFVQHLEVTGIGYDEVKRRSDSLKDTDILPYHLTLHKLYDKELLGKTDKQTFLISIPLLGAVAGLQDPKNRFGGQGAFFLYLIPKQNTSFNNRNFKNLSKNISRLTKEITYNYIFDIGLEHAKKARKSSVKAAIIQYMARNLSHNTGSHLIPEAIIYFRGHLDDERGEEFTYYQKYTQERMELLAQMSSMKKINSWTNYRLQELISEFHLSIIPKGLCDDLNNNYKKIVLSLNNGLEDIYISLPNGAVGKQAFYVILENFIRNAYKHSSPHYNSFSEQDEYFFCVNIDLSSSESEFWCIDLYDKLGNDNKSKRDNALLEKMRFQIKDDVLIEGELRQSGWGMLEMKSAAAYLKNYPLEDLDEFPDEWFSVNYYDDSGKISSQNYNMGHRFYLYKPKILIIDEDFPGYSKNDKSLLKKGITFENLHTDDYKKLPHQFILTNKNLEFSNQKILREYINPNLTIDEIENNLWQQYLDTEPEQKLLIISKNTEQTENDKHPIAYFDDHGKDLKFKNKNLKCATKSEIEELQLYYYHPFISRSKIDVFVNLKEQPRFRGLLVEAIRTKVLIVDERIQNAAQYNDNNQSNLLIKDILSLIGVDLPDYEKLNLSEYLEKPNNDNKREEILKLIKDSKYQYVLLHLTILEKLVGNKDKKALSDFITDSEQINESQVFDKENRAFILISGRGEPPNLPDHCYYINYTTLYDSLIYRMSKPHFIQTLSTIRKK